MQRVMIVGQPGSGKSTLARALGARTGLPVVHIDLIHWQPGWKERSREEKTRLCREVEARESWIFEGGHSATWDERLARADMLVWIDRPVGLRLRRVLGRTWRSYGRTRPDLPDGCPEQLRTLPEFIRFIWRTRHSARDRIARLAGSATCEVVHLRSDREVSTFLSRFDGGGPC
jgi:adenylate kinase family enzyme